MIMYELTVKSGLAISTLGLVGISQLDPITAGAKLGTATTSVVLGVVCVACVYAMYRQYTDAQKRERDHNAALYTLVETAAKSAQSNADSNREVVGILVEVKNEMLQCRALRVGRGG